MAGHDRTPMGCPTCGKVLLGPSAVRYHHGQTHDLSLSQVPPDEWPEYVEEHADEIVNPEGTTFRERTLSPRHPIYADAEGGE